MQLKPRPATTLVILAACSLNGLFQASLGAQQNTTTVSTTSDSAKGVSMPVTSMLAIPSALSHLPPSAVLVPLCRQATDYTCGAASLQSVLGYYGDDFNESDLARPLNSNSEIGTRYKAMEKFARAKGYEVTIYREATLQQLKALLDKQQPVIVLIQAWSEKPTDYTKDWKDGHYVVAIGHDLQNIYFMDPSTLGNYTFIPVKEFESRWHDKDSDEKLVHFAMTVSKPHAKYVPTKVEYMP